MKTLFRTNAPPPFVTKQSRFATGGKTDPNRTTTLREHAVWRFHVAAARPHAPRTSVS
jgi:hypothetical protein